MKTFSDLEIDDKIKKSLSEIGFTDMTDIQLKVIPLALDGEDIIAQSRTGSGKTAAFGVPAINSLKHENRPQVLIIGPTRELVNQVANEMKKFGKHTDLKVAAIFGGVAMNPQYSNLKKADVIVATPGRLLDHSRRGTVKLGSVKTVILDEADKMFEMGFIDDIKTILSLTSNRKQTMLFSATIKKEIEKIVMDFMNSPKNVAGEKNVSSSKLKQFYIDCKKEEKISVLNYVIKKENPEICIVFCSTRQITDFVADQLKRLGQKSDAIHGKMRQEARLRVINRFKEKKTRILVATDVAARGLDIKDVTHIFNYDIPRKVDEYTHRIGRTARYGENGRTVTLLCKEDHQFFRKICANYNIDKMEKPKNFQPIKIFFKRPPRRFNKRRRS